MCGISGIVGVGAEHQLVTLTRMSERIAHRGPDDAGVWTSADAALAHRRLSIIDLSPDGRQPMVTDCGRYAITFNGEIYNYKELRLKLEALGDRFRSSSDTEVLLASVRRWGLDALHRLNGMWAFAVWDRETKTLMAARDRFGKKPFYYALCNGYFYFASEVKALLVIPGFSTQPEPTAIADFAVERVSDHRESTFFTGINQLRPAHTLTWSRGRITTARYWQVPAGSSDNHRKDSLEEIRDLFRSAVELRLRADTLVGCLVSGGLDSSAAICFSQIGSSEGKPQHIFSTVHDPPEEEADGIAAVRQKFPHLAFHPDQPGADQFWQDLPKVLWHQEQPFGDASMVAHYGLMRLARRVGVPVLLSGQGADEVFAGYPGYLWVYLGSRPRRGELSAFASFWAQAKKHRAVPLRNVALNMLPQRLARCAKQISGNLRMNWIAPGFRSSSAAIFHDVTEHADADPLDQALLQSIAVRTLPGFLHYEDRNSMAHGVETRLPYLDYRLAELLFEQSAASKVRGGVTKHLLREISTGIVPDSIRLRMKKTGYPAPLKAWLRGRRQELLETSDFRNCPLLDHPAWEREVRSFIAGDGSRLISVWRGYILARWYALFFGRESPA
jgi:asparagine synthase (glutamine-hydrolysing)